MYIIQSSVEPKKRIVNAHFASAYLTSITAAGVSEYRLNGRVHSYNSYNRQLEAFRILVKAKNFLVFQGDVESVAQQNSRDLAHLVDQISGSLELKEEYEQAKERMERSQEESAAAFNKRRGINGELKTFREQKAEAERWERLQEERVSEYSATWPRM